MSDTTRLPIERIEVFRNYRVDFDGIDELAANIDSVGLMQPLVVRKDPAAERWFLVAGERRLRAIRTLGWAEVPVRVVDAADERDATWLTLLENEARRNPNAIEQAVEYAAQIDRHGRSVEEIAAAIGRRPGYVRDRLALLELSQPVQAAVRSGALPQSQALAIRDLDHNRQAIAMREFLANPAWTAEQFAARVAELRGGQTAEAQGGMWGEEFMTVEVYEIPDVSPRRKVGAIGMARILARIRDEVELPAGIVPLVDKAIEDHLGEKAQARRGGGAPGMADDERGQGVVTAIAEGIIEAVSGSRRSSYGPGSIADQALARALSLLEDLDAGEVSVEYGYGEAPATARRITLDGGGPAAELLIVDDEAFVIYYEGAGRAVVMLPDHRVAELVEALSSPWLDPEERS